MRTNRRYVTRMIVLGSLALLFAATPASETSTAPDGATTAGEWAGTWYYVARDYKVALWFRGKGKAVEARLRSFRSRRWFSERLSTM